MADYSMASLNENSMADINDSGYKIPVKVQANSSGSQVYISGKTQEDSEQSEGANMLDALKEELGMPSAHTVSATDQSFNKVT